ncbi:hypothetical protein Dimus_009319 [Dionaea muscipula]
MDPDEYYNCGAWGCVENVDEVILMAPEKEDVTQPLSIVIVEDAVNEVLDKPVPVLGDSDWLYEDRGQREPSSIVREAAEGVVGVHGRVSGDDNLGVGTDDVLYNDEVDVLPLLTPQSNYEPPRSNIPEARDVESPVYHFTVKALRNSLMSHEFT